MKLGNCRLCGNERPLCQSHIIPEFIYKPLYDPTDKNRIYGFREKNKSVQVFQKGLWQYLFCRECEDVFHRYENHVSPIYANDFWTQGVPLKYADGGICPDAVELKGINYTQFKLLFLSIFWRLSISTKYFNQINLGPYHDTIKRMIVNCDAGTERRHGIMVCRLTLGGEHLSGLVGAFQNGRSGPQFRTHVVILGGYAIYLWLGKPDIPDKLIGFMTRERGSQVIPTLEFEKMQSLHYFPDMLKRAHTPFWK